MFDEPAEVRALAEEAGAELLQRQAEPDGLTEEADGRIGIEAVEAEAGDMEYLPVREDVAVDEILEDAVRAAPRRDAVPLQRPELLWIAVGAPYDLGIRTPGIRQVGLQHFLEGKGRHLGVRLRMQQPVDGMFGRFSFLPISQAFIHMDGERPHGARHEAHAGIVRGKPHG